MERRGKTINSDLNFHLTSNKISKLESLGCKALKDEMLSKHVSFKIGGPADYLVEIPAKEALKEFFRQIQTDKVFVLGGGTNILFDSGGFRGAVIKLTGCFEEFSFDGETLTCGSAALLPLLVSESAKRNLSGLEFCAGIPGTVGGALFGNAGTPQGNISDALQSCEVFNAVSGEFEILNQAEIEFEYRRSSIKGIICGAVFSLKSGRENDILNLISAALDRRKHSQPSGVLSAGCIFKNPPHLSAGKLIDECGLKGRKIGGAQISQKHANFIINCGNAQSADVLELIEIARAEAEKQFGVKLETEIRIIK
ncbi:MAG: UDP-N-acetylmuramate dehydrogenase [Elusimicrobiota bacterium]|nr:UDP-N-acetylmuramate dehydrogenase [Elusimicrobiota bacterium]